MARPMVSASTGAMNSVLAKLIALLGDEYKLLRSMKSDITFLTDELRSMKGLMEKLADEEDLDPLVKGWMRQVRELAYDLEDCIDRFVHKAGQGDRRSRLITMLTSQHRFATQLRELKKRILDSSDRRNRYRLDDAGTSSERRKRYMVADADNSSGYHRLPSLNVEADRLVGIDGPREDLIELLTDGQQQLKVVSIVGFGGLGKTTLAMDVYRRLEGPFDCRAVVSVSQFRDTKRVLQDTLLSVKGYASRSSIEAFDEAQLVDALRDFLYSKRYFIIFDDLWSTSTSRIIKCALPENGRGSIILVTTRMISVAQSCCSPGKGCIFKMPPLGSVAARALFFRIIFHPEETCPPQLVEISDNILKKCGGLPLAIITIASLLASKPHVTEEWESVTNSIGLALSSNSNLEGMRVILNLSYVNLPFHLRTCLLYLSMFPEDYIIDRELLLRRWMAEGFITAERGKDLEEVGELYFNELINRSLIQPVGIQHDDRVYSCRVHDIILDLIISKSAEENFATIYGDHDHKFTLQDGVRRLSLDSRNRGDTYIPSEITTSHVRSLAIIGFNGQMPSPANFHALRVLDVECFGELENGYLKDIGGLYLLKYLRLQTTTTIALPERIQKLQYLETLDLSRAQISKLPKGIARLRKLIYLLVSDVKLPDGIGNLQALKELSRVNVESSNSASSLQDLGRLTALRVLGLKWCISDTNTEKKSYADNLGLSLHKLSSSNLQSLYIESSDGCSLDFLLDCLFTSYHLRELQMKSDYHFPVIPKWVASLVSLTLLRINIDIVGEEVLQILGELPALLALLLSVKSTASKQGLVIRNNGFQCLKQFDLTFCNSWAMLVFEPGAMQNLEKLRLVCSEQGECVHNGFHFGIEHLASLKHLVVEIKCRDVRAREVDAAEDAIKKAVSDHPNRPRLELQRQAEEHIVKDEREITVHGEEEEGHNEGVMMCRTSGDGRGDHTTTES